MRSEASASPPRSETRAKTVCSAVLTAPVRTSGGMARPSSTQRTASRSRRWTARMLA